MGISFSPLKDSCQLPQHHNPNMLRPKHNSNWTFIGKCGHLLLCSWPKGEGKSFVSLNLKHDTGSVNNQQQRGVYLPVTQKLFPQVSSEDEWLVLQHNAISSRKSSWRKWQATPNSFKRPQLLKKKHQHIMSWNFVKKKAKQRGVRAYKARVAHLRSPSKTQAECAMNETHALMTKFGNHYLLVLSIYGAWEVVAKLSSAHQLSY